MQDKTTKFHPILFSTPMVQAILEGRKTQTRRTKGLESINKNPDALEHVGIVTIGNIALPKNEFRIYQCFEEKANGKQELVKCPYELDDVLWVRENFYTFENWDHWKPSMFKSVNVEVFYTADLQNDYISKPVHRGKTRPNIFLPAAYCRIFLKVKSIRVERLQDIREEDAKSEGVIASRPGLWKNYLVPETYWSSTISSFETLWISINGKESMNHNPYVFVYEFEQIEKPLDFIV